MAMKTFPDLQGKIEEASGPIALWIDLNNELVSAYDQQTPDDERIRKIYAYADWCIDQPQSDDPSLDDVSSAAAVGLIEDIPMDERISNDLHRWMSAETFEGYENLFRYHLSEEQFQRFSQEFLRKRRLFVERRKLD
jgi:hypothetical protein